MSRAKINLVYLINSLDVGGAEIAMVRLLSTINNREKYNIRVVALQEGSGRLLSQLKDLSISVYNLGARSKYDLLRTGIKLKHILEDQATDVLVCSLFRATILGRIVGRVARVLAIVNWEHNENLGGVSRQAINKITCVLSHKIICDSEAVGRIIEGKLKLCRSKITVIPIGGIDTSIYKRAKHERSINEIKIGSVGSLTKQKAYDSFLLIAQEVLKKYRHTKFFVVGDGPEYSALLKKIDELDLSGHVQLLGYREDIAAILSEWDIYVQPSRWEGLCITVIEAMAAGLPVVAMDVGGISESVIDGETGFLVSPGDYKAFSDTIRRLIENPQLRTEMGEAGRRRAEKKYSLVEMGRRFESLLDALIEKKLGLVYSQSTQRWKSV